jgi:hypothetical protein
MEEYSLHSSATGAIIKWWKYNLQVISEHFPTVATITIWNVEGRKS